MDFYVGPAPARVPGELRVEKLFAYPAAHPLAQAKSLRELADAHWITTSITHWARCSRSMACPRRSWRCGRNPR